MSDPNATQRITNTAYAETERERRIQAFRDATQRASMTRQIDKAYSLLAHSNTDASADAWIAAWLTRALTLTSDRS